MGNWTTNDQKRLTKILRNKSENDYRSAIVKSLNNSGTFCWPNDPGMYSNLGTSDIIGLDRLGVLFALELKICKFDRSNPNKRVVYKGQFTPNQVNFLSNIHKATGYALGGMIVPDIKGKDTMIVLMIGDILDLENLTVKWALHHNIWVRLKDITLDSIFYPLSFEKVYNLK